MSKPDAAHLLAQAIAAAAKAGLPTSGAVLGTVRSNSPTLDVELDTGQYVPQVAGPDGMSPGQRVLCHYINQGHDIAVTPFGGSYYAIARYVHGDGETYQEFSVTSGPAVPYQDGTQVVVVVGGIYIVHCVKLTGIEYEPYTWQVGAGAKTLGSDELYLPAGSIVSWDGGGAGNASKLTLDLRAPMGGSSCD